jgi:predicted flap endonuclease-1-like 5' DNA nuclease
MATKTKKVNSTKENNKVQNTASEVNTKAATFTTKMVEETVASGKEWQKVIEKAIKGGLNIFEQQQDFVLTTLESLKGQYQKDSNRLKGLFTFKTTESKVEKTKAALRKKAALKTSNKKAVSAAVKTTKSVAKKTSTVKKATTAAPLKKSNIPTTIKTKTTNSKVKATKAKVEKANPVVSVTTKKVAAKKAVSKKVVKSNLKLIEGIGPKLESILNEAGIHTFQQLSAAKVSSLKEILAAAGPRYKMFDPSTWSEQANLAAANKMDALKALQLNIKNGKKQ